MRDDEEDDETASLEEELEKRLREETGPASPFQTLPYMVAWLLLRIRGWPWWCYVVGLLGVVGPLFLEDTFDLRCFYMFGAASGYLRWPAAARRWEQLAARWRAARAPRLRALGRALRRVLHRIGRVVDAYDEWVFPALVVAFVVLLSAMAPTHAPAEQFWAEVRANATTAAATAAVQAPPALAARARGAPHWHLECGYLPYRCLSQPTDASEARAALRKRKARKAALCALVDVATGSAVSERLTRLSDVVQRLRARPLPELVDVAASLSASAGWAPATDGVLLTLGGPAVEAAGR